MAEPVYPTTEDELLEYLGEAIHTAFRKATDCPQAHPIWKLIEEMPPKDWESVLTWVASAPEPVYGLSVLLRQRNAYRAALDEVIECGPHEDGGPCQGANCACPYGIALTAIEATP